MNLEPGELYWEDRDGYTYWIVGLADGGSEGFWNEDHARAIADVERARATGSPS